MSKVRPRVLVAGLFCFFAICLQPCANAIVEQTSAKDTALPAPEVFAPGIISGPANDGSPTFSPDGSTLFFTRSSAHWSIILESHRLKGGWSEPKVASFSGEWSDSSPALSPDGSYLVFVSVRPLTADSPQAKQGSSPIASHIWRVNRVGSGWSAPVQLPESVNSFQWIFRPSVAADGSIYFTAAVKGKELSLFRSQYQNGAYRNAEPLSFSDGSVKDVDPEIAPDQSFLVFTSKRLRPGDTSHEHLFIVYNQGGVWGSIVPIRYAGDDANGSSEDNDPRFGADHRTVYFSSDRTLAVHYPRTREQANEDYQRLQTWDNSNSNIWVISLSPELKEATSSQSKL
ncbi:TolB family protein [Tunturibacter empetritectus]|uniref:Tol biopolymer transport system component n=1 Tax=Tunturiibacter empetritectus TaxID=3069691 RepID=A0A7W8MSU0_9BACT|nr:PD40 domain-containing protein [Edaphobacter lichenicola]MBB5318747.1 Tol biopolymer transport system component [Edaphobacter lichenicola]